MVTLEQAKKDILSNLVEVEGSNFRIGEFSRYAFKDYRWGSACNVFYMKGKGEGRYLILSEFSPELNNQKFAISEAKHFLHEETVYSITNLTEKEKKFIKKFIINSFFSEEGIC